MGERSVGGGGGLLDGGFWAERGEREEGALCSVDRGWNGRGEKSAAAAAAVVLHDGGEWEKRMKE